MKCEFGTTIDGMLRYQLVIGLRREDIRRRLLAKDKLNLQKAIDIISVEEQVEKEASYFKRLRLVPDK